MSYTFMPHPSPVPPPMAPTKATIKMALEGPNAEKDGPFVRIQLTGEIGPQAMETLRKRALDLHQATSGISHSNLDDAKVLFTYRDSENDLCFIFSDDDLRCALPLFPSSLRVFARVELPPATADSKSTQTADRSFSGIPVHEVVESVTGVLTAANTALQKHVKKARSTQAPEPVPPPPVAPAAVETAPVVDPPVAASAGVAEAVPEERLFIHGRHTCDGCLTTPIVGKRFHAANLPDYDLCSACKDNYKGAEITFEEAVNDRDKPMQERWYRRFSKWTHKNQRQAEKQVKKEERIAARRSCRGPGPRGPGGPPHGPPHRPPGHGPPHRHHYGPPRGWNQHPRSRYFGAPAENCGPPPEQVDQALKEAIRRSMLDLKQSKKENVQEKEKEETNQVDAPASKEPAAVKEAPKEEKDIPVAEAPMEEEFEIPPEAPVGVFPARSAEEPEEKEPDIVVDAKVAAVEDKAKPTVNEESFSDDAEGNGEVAAALGETMDAIANAITEMTSELESTLTKEFMDDASQKSEDEVLVETASENAGATIVSGEEDVEEKSDDGSQTSWDVVTSDEALARAAQVIGSALFESGTASAIQAASNGSVSMLGSDASIPTSVPSVASENPAPAQMDRWALQLKQLHELGFNDDATNVDIMERFQAANIGSGEEEEVSVEKVVNELMKNW
uniref:ZZ-type domain-containing protein n=1 Tax=Entomoneis paludosa TaxID=265537 RepID=A0A7S2VCR6_9STRA